MDPALHNKAHAPLLVMALFLGTQSINQRTAPADGRYPQSYPGKTGSGAVTPRLSFIHSFPLQQIMKHGHGPCPVLPNATTHNEHPESATINHRAWHGLRRGDCSRARVGSSAYNVVVFLGCSSSRHDGAAVIPKPGHVRQTLGCQLHVMTLASSRRMKGGRSSS